MFQLGVSIEGDLVTFSVPPKSPVPSLLRVISLACPNGMTGESFLQEMVDLASAPPDGVRANRIAIVLEMLTGLKSQDVAQYGGLLLNCSMQTGRDYRRRVPLFKSWTHEVSNIS